MSDFARLCFLFFIISCLGCAQKPIEKQSIKWKPFVLDEDLSHFQVLNGTAEYYVENNTIVGVSTIGSPNTFLCTRELYNDFILEFEVWADPQLNSGVQFRSNRFEDKMEGRVHGYQAEIESSDRKWAGGIYDEGRRGWLYPLDKNPDAKNAFTVNEWNHYRIEAIGDELITWVNATQCTHLVDDLTSDGFIGFQVHSIGEEALANKKVKWRNIRILTDGVEKAKWPRIGSVPVINLIEDKS